eukprot:1144464-Pelagomonas_calceolata.AAC.4
MPPYAPLRQSEAKAPAWLMRKCCGMSPSLHGDLICHGSHLITVICHGSQLMTASCQHDLICHGINLIYHVITVIYDGSQRDLQTLFTCQAKLLQLSTSEHGHVCIASFALEERPQPKDKNTSPTCSQQVSKDKHRPHLLSTSEHGHVCIATLTLEETPKPKEEARALLALNGCARAYARWWAWQRRDSASLKIPRPSCFP